MLPSGTANTITKEMLRYHLLLVGMTECSWLSSCYSGNQDEDALHRKGTAFMVSKKAKSVILAWEPISDKIITIRMNGNSRMCQL